MYGMLLESVKYFVQLEYGEDVWERVLQDSKCRYADFNTHQVYPDTLITDLAASCAKITSSTEDAFMQFFGRCFVRYFSNFGYDAMIKATGRYFSDFLQSVDNIHMQMRFTYPKMQSPSMFITHIDEEGVVLIYRSGRAGFMYYFMGQLYQIAKELYDFDLDIQLLQTQDVGNVSGGTGDKNVQVMYRLNYDNREYIASRQQKNRAIEKLSLAPVSANVLLELFKFGILINRDMQIIGAGEKLLDAWGGEVKDILMQPVDKFFKLRRPKGIPFTWNNTIYLHSVMFELEFFQSETEHTEENGDGTPKIEDGSKSKQALEEGTEVKKEEKVSILLQGQMRFIKDINCIVFLCTPLINNLDELLNMGLFLADLNPHGMSREMVMQGWQNGSRLEMMYENAEEKSTELEKNHELLETWKRRGDELVYSMMPKTVADRLRLGINPTDTCETFDSISILFAELVGLTSETVEDAMDVVAIMNAVFSCFDTLMDEYDVYKVETVGQVYMSASGAPERTPDHAQRIVDVAIAQVEGIKKLDLKTSMKVDVRIGVHTGSAVAGVVGNKAPRYCFFGDTVNTASRMQSSGEPGKVQISTITNDNLPKGRFDISPRGTVKVKGKGDMQTFWVNGWLNRR